MLIYDPNRDPYHCAIRILAVLDNRALQALPIESVRIADYYLAYPSKIADIRLPQQFRYIRTQAKKLTNPYRHPLGIKASFERLRPIFLAAASGLVAAGFVDEVEFKNGQLKATDKSLPEALRAAVSSFLARESDVRKFVVSQLLEIPLLGNDGLKHRSGLAEHRYDSA